jgi:hypothetical protein
MLGAMHLVIIGMLLSAIWAGSWSRLWHDAAYRPVAETLVNVGMLAAVDVAMAALAFCYLNLRRALQALTLAISVILSGLAVVGAISVVLHRQTITAPVSVSMAITAKSLLAVGYCLCAFLLWGIGNVTLTHVGADREE